MNGSPIPFVGNKPILTRTCMTVWIIINNIIPNIRLEENIETLLVIL
jgi:hypothetical protein